MSKKNSTWSALLFLVAPVLICLVLWYTNTVSDAGFEYSVPTFLLVPQMETTNLYLYLHVFTFVPILFLSFDRRVHYYTRWKHLIPAIVSVAIPFFIWDIVFTEMGIWGFNHQYHLATSFLGLPLEEWLFFITVPFACLFIYECLNYYFPKDVLAPLDALLSIGTGIVFLFIGFYHIEKLYTATTFILTGSLLLFHYINFENTYRTRFYLAYLVTWIPFMLVDGALTGSFTDQPVVLYHPEEFMGWRIGSVPVEDSIYSLLMLMGGVSVYEFLRAKSWSQKAKSDKYVSPEETSSVVA